VRSVRQCQIGHCLKDMLLLIDSVPESYLHLPNKSLLRSHCLDLSKSIRIPSVDFLFFSFVFISPPSPETSGTTVDVSSVFPPWTFQEHGTKSSPTVILIVSCYLTERLRRQDHLVFNSRFLDL
jgi:hypothetical protein